MARSDHERRLAQQRYWRVQHRQDVHFSVLWPRPFRTLGYRRLAVR